MTHTLRVMFMAWVLLSATSCYIINVTRYPNYITDFQRGDEYRLKQDAVVYQSNMDKWLKIQYAPFTIWMFPSKYLMRMGKPFRPASTNEYIMNSSRWQKKGYVGVITAGTRLKYVRTVHDYYFSDWDTDPIVEILDGPFRGQKASVADISQDIFQNEPLFKGDKYYLYRVYMDPAWLEVLTDVPRTNTYANKAVQTIGDKSPQSDR